MTKQEMMFLDRMAKYMIDNNCIDIEQAGRAILDIDRNLTNQVFTKNTEEFSKEMAKSVYKQIKGESYENF